MNPLDHETFANDLDSQLSERLKLTAQTLVPDSVHVPKPGSHSLRYGSRKRPSGLLVIVAALITTTMVVLVSTALFRSLPLRTNSLNVISAPSSEYSRFSSPSSAFDSVSTLPNTASASPESSLPDTTDAISTVPAQLPSAFSDLPADLKDRARRLELYWQQTSANSSGPQLPPLSEHTTAPVMTALVKNGQLSVSFTGAFPNADEPCGYSYKALGSRARNVVIVYIAAKINPNYSAECPLVGRGRTLKVALEGPLPTKGVIVVDLSNGRKISLTKS